MKEATALVATLLMAILLAGCGKSPQEKLVGTWQEVDSNQNIVEFFEDGSFSLKRKKGEVSFMENLNGRWLILTDGRIKIDISMLGITHSQVGKLDFDGKEMIITEDNGTPTRHKRLK